MFAALLCGARHLGRRLIHALNHCLLVVTQPSPARLVEATPADLSCTKRTLIVENALLRQQLVVVRRSVKRVHCTPTDRGLLVLLASRVRTWRHALLIVQPETLLRRRRQGFRLV